MAINFVDNPVYSFWGTYCACMQNRDLAEKVLSGFEDEKLSRLTGLTVAKEIKNWDNRILQDIAKENITDFNGLKSVMSKYFSTQKLENLDKLESAFDAYLSFHDKNKSAINKNIETLDKNQSSYATELKNLYSCFDIPSDKHCTCFLSPFPKDKMMDGISNPTCVSMDYSLQKNEDESHYVGDSDILKRKASTPFHEATHFLFLNSQLKKDIEQEKTLGIKALMDELIKSFDKDGQPVEHNQAKKYALGAINEAFAACSTALYNEKTTEKPVTNDNEWYYGWKQANDLAKQMYPLFKDYVKEGKAFDDAFLCQLTSKIKIDRIKTELREVSSPVSETKPTNVNMNTLNVYLNSKQNS